MPNSAKRLDTREESAKAIGVSHDSRYKAKFIKEHKPELLDEVEKACLAENQHDFFSGGSLNGSPDSARGDTNDTAKLPGHGILPK